MTDKVAVFLDFLEKLPSPEQCAIAGVRGIKIDSLPGLLDKIEQFQQSADFTILNPNGELRAPYNQIASAAISHNPETDLAVFNRAAGEATYKGIISQPLLKR